MDVNGTRYFLRSGASDWAPLIAADQRLEWDPHHPCARLRSRAFQFGGPAAATALGAAARRGAGRDTFNTWYWIGEDRRGLRYWPAGQGAAGGFWDTGELTRPSCPLLPTAQFRGCAPAPLQEAPLLSGLAVTRDHYLLVGTLAPAGLLVFDLHGGGLPVWQPWPTGFRPWDLAADADGGAWILDTDPDDPAGGARLWHLDCHFQPLDARLPIGGGPAPLAPFQPVAPAPDGRPRRLPDAGTDPLPRPLAGLAAAPVAVEPLTADAVLLLDNPPGLAYSSVVLLDASGAVAFSLARALDGDGIRAHDLAFVPAAGTAAAPGTLAAGTLYLVAVSGNQAFAFDLRVRRGAAGVPELLLTLLRKRYYPMRRFAGRALVAAGGTPYYDLGERWLPLAEQPQPLFELEGVTAPLLLDSQIPGCRWHRVLLDACIPNGAGVSVATRAADDRDQLALLPWTPEEPVPYPRAEGSELPWQGALAGAGTSAGTGVATGVATGTEGRATWETLIQRARGRYLELRLHLRGTGRNSPRLWALRVHYPRFSYLDAYLPTVYREDPESADFLDRWLANPEGLLTSLEGRIAAAEVLFDARTAPADYLEWLAGWLGAVLDPAWDEARRRLFLGHAATLFRWRGTPSGLLAAIRLASDPCPDAAIFADLGQTPALGTLAGYQVRIVEGHAQRLLPGVVLGDATAAPLPAPAAADERWQPAQGAARLHGLFQTHLALRYPDGAGGLHLGALGNAWGQTIRSLDQVRFPPLLPTHPVQAADWRTFVDRRLALHYEAIGAQIGAQIGPASGTADLDAWRRFLAARYRSAAAMNGAYGRPAAGPPADFAQVAWPTRIPEGRVELGDWIAFVSLALPIRRAANRFTVLVPVTPNESAAVRDTRLARVQAVVERERPAHTRFEIKPYWALFQVGTARLGLDTVLGQGSRYTAIVLAASHLGEGYLAESHPWNVRGRRVVGRDPITIDRSAEA